MTTASLVVDRWLKEAITFGREFYLPPEARDKDPEIPEGTDLAVWRYEGQTRGGPRYYAIAFAGKQGKPLWHHAFRSEAERQRYIDQTIESRKGTLERKQKQQQERSQFKHEFNVGDILVSSWGYDQTNYDYYEVTKILGPQMVEIRELHKKYLGSEGTVDIVAPDPGSYDGPPLRKRVSPGHSVRITSFSSASKWDGKPDRPTNSNYGH